MKWVKLRRASVGCAALVWGVFSVGCGGGGGDDDDQSTPPQQNQFAPQNVNGQQLTLDGGTASARQIIFDASGAMWTENRDGTFGGGAYQYRVIEGGGSADLILTGAGTDASIRLAFASSRSGTFQYGSGEEGQGTFTLQAAPDGSGPTDPGDSPGSELAPPSLSGRTLFGTRTFTSTGPVGQTHVYTFSATGFHDSDPPEESDGVFAYEPNGHRAALTLSYYSPQNFNGDRHELQLTFHTENSGAFQSVYTRRDGTVIRINGNFELQ